MCADTAASSGVVLATGPPLVTQQWAAIAQQGPPQSGRTEVPCCNRSLVTCYVVLRRAVLCCLVQAYKHEAVLGLYVCFVHETQLWMVMPYMEVSAVKSRDRTQPAATVTESLACEICRTSVLCPSWVAQTAAS